MQTTEIVQAALILRLLFPKSSLSAMDFLHIFQYIEIIRNAKDGERR